MSQAAPKAIAVSNALDDVMRRDKGRLVAGLTARLGDLQMAEDALQDAILAAMRHWASAGLPKSPTAWLMRAALNKGIDRYRAAARDAGKINDLAQLAEPGAPVEDAEPIPDERLRLIFACCHPALEEKSRLALTLRTVCGLTTFEIARAFLDSETTMGQRLSRAKAKIRDKGIGFSYPDPEHWDARLGTVQSTIYLIFTTGYVSEDESPRDLCREALFLGALLCRLRPEVPEIEGALALMRLAEARKTARIGADGAMVPIASQDRALWDSAMIQSARTLLEHAISRKRPGPYQIKAAIADCAMCDPGPDWAQMSFLYQSLWHHEPTPVVALNWAIVLHELGESQLALEKIDALKDTLADFQPWHAARADVLARAGRTAEAAEAYRHARKTAPNEASRRFLSKRLDALAQQTGT